MDDNRDSNHLETEIVNEYFPREESFDCWDGTERKFTITCRQFPNLGFFLYAVEKGKDYLGYQFGSHDAYSPELAFGKLRNKMSKTLATRHISRKNGFIGDLHGTIQGHIGYSDDFGIAFIVDGTPITSGDLLDMLRGYEGWQFKIQLADMSEDFRQ